VREAAAALRERNQDLDGVPPALSPTTLLSLVTVPVALCGRRAIAAAAG
jgi:hypothetical protein